MNDKGNGSSLLNQLIATQKQLFVADGKTLRENGSEQEEASFSPGEIYPGCASDNV